MTNSHTIRCLSVALLGLCWLVAPMTAGNLKADGQFISTEPTVPPLVVSSSEKVANLNADLLDDLTAADFLTQQQPRVHQAVFASAGNSVFVVPEGVTSLEVTVIGAGGGGGGGSDFAGGGGGGGGLVVATLVLVKGGESLTVAVGSAGTAGEIGQPGDPGEASVLSGADGWRVQADGGLGGDGAPANFEGGNGGDGLFGGGAGQGLSVSGLGGDGIFADGEDATPAEGGAGASGGAGGEGPGGGGGGGGPGGGDGGVTTDGLPGSQPGAGGGGGGDSVGSGGDGAPGAIVIEWFGPPLPS